MASDKNSNPNAKERVRCYCTNRCGGPNGLGKLVAYSTRQLHLKQDLLPSQTTSQTIRPRIRKKPSANPPYSIANSTLHPGKRQRLESLSTTGKLSETSNPASRSDELKISIQFKFILRSGSVSCKPRSRFTISNS